MDKFKTKGMWAKKEQRWWVWRMSEQGQALLSSHLTGQGTEA